VIGYGGYVARLKLSSRDTQIAEDDLQTEADTARQLEDPLINSSLQLRFRQLLLSIYLPLETWYLKFIIERVSSYDSLQICNVTTSRPGPQRIQFGRFGFQACIDRSGRRFLRTEVGTFSNALVG
jgi:hypothetical protein